MLAAGSRQSRPGGTAGSGQRGNGGRPQGQPALRLVQATGWLMVCVVWLALLALVGTRAPVAEGAASLADRECLRCHGDPALTRAQPGERSRTMYVDRAVLAR